MEDKNRVSTEMDLPLESEPFFKEIKVDKWDKIFAVAYLFLGYGLWKTGQYDSFFNISGFVLFYIAVVSLYCFVKGFHINGEKIFWSIILLGIGISLPVLVIILPVLSQADAGFSRMLTRVFERVFVFEGGLFLQLCIEIPVVVILSSLMFGTVYGGIYQRNIEKGICKEYKEISGEGFHIIPDVAIYTFAGIIGFTYLLFIAFQAKYLFSACGGILPESFTYAEYARQGFFELCGITAFNVLLLFFMNIFARTVTRENKVLSVINIAFSTVTILLLITAMSKMGMYITAYGFTIKRIQASVFMIWLFLVLFMIICHQKKKIPLVRWAVFLGAVLYTLLCILPLEAMLS